MHATGPPRGPGLRTTALTTPVSQRSVTPSSLSPAHEGQPLQQEVPGLLQALCVGAPVLQSVVAEVPQHVQTLGRRDVPVATLLDLREDPGFDESAPAGQWEDFTFM